MQDLYIDMTKCTGCRECEAACAKEHGAASEVEGIALADHPEALDTAERAIRLQTSVAYARFEHCVHCVDAPCVDACPNSAMTSDDRLGVVYVDTARCQGCFMCGMVCPFGAISVHPVTGTALKCDGCRDRALRGERPACVEACTTGALTCGGPRFVARERQRAAAATLAVVFRNFGTPQKPGA